MQQVGTEFCECNIVSQEMYMVKFKNLNKTKDRL